MGSLYSFLDICLGRISRKTDNKIPIRAHNWQVEGFRREEEEEEFIFQRKTTVKQQIINDFTLLKAARKAKRRSMLATYDRY